MPQLDAMLRGLAERGAVELRLAEGSRPVFRYPDGDRPVSQIVLSRARIYSLLTELAETEDAVRMAAGEPVRFFYSLADGSLFACEIGVPDSDTLARVIPSPAPARREADIPRSPEEFDDAPPKMAVCPEPPPLVAAGREVVENIDALLRRMVELGASDLHVSAGETPMVRLHGDMKRIDEVGVLSAEQAAAVLLPLMPPRYAQQFEETNDTDFAHEIAGLARFRCNVFTDRKGIGGVFRVIPSRIPTAEDLGIPKGVLDLCHLHKGLVLVTGPTGSGKSTTLAALVDHINSNRSDHIITIEDPIEFVHSNRLCLINQREVGTHTLGFKNALRAALREDPDIVLVGEMRDLETIAIAIETAETGHLVFGTLHTSTAASTVDRIIDQFPADRQSQIRVMLSESLRGVVSQTLCKKVGGGRIAALEVLVGNQAVSNLIREGKSYQIPSIMQTSRKFGMILLNDSLMELVRKKVVTPEEAWMKAADKTTLLGQLRSAGFELPGAVPATASS